MSNDFLNDPNFNVEGMEDIKGAIDTFFANNKQAVVKKPAKTKPEADETTTAKPKSKGRAKLKLPDVPKQSDEEISEAIEYGTDEIDCIREEFYEFQAAISHLAIYPYIYKDIEIFVESVKEMMDVIENNIDSTKLSAAGRKDYEELLKTRARILSSIFNNYKNEG